jgi:[ribosomal protein S18]-alanine N-acetyltransferase
MRIRRATRDDFQPILDIERLCPTAAHWKEADYVQAIENVAAQRIVLVADHNNHILGFLVARLVGRDWELENVAVNPGNQRKGIGQALLRVLIDVASQNGAESIFLEVRESNSSARTLYERCGFQHAGERKEYYSTPTENAVLYRFLCTSEHRENR